MKYLRGSTVVDATQWFRNGDHPEDDNYWIRVVFRSGPFFSEGQVVRYFRPPGVDPRNRCTQCQQAIHEHGWIDTSRGGHIVCPGDWVVTNGSERFPVKDAVFRETYIPLAEEAVV